MLNPQAEAEKNRALMMKQDANGVRKYLIAEIEGSGQSGNVYDKYFRPKDYIKERVGLSQNMKDWLSASTSEVWSDKFLGLDDNGLQKLEFQNPAYAAAYRLKGDPREYNRVFAVQLNGCTYECAFCFVPSEINNPETGKGHFFSASEILDQFEKSRKASIKEDGKDIKVIRLTGGEVPSIVPELIVDVWKEMDKRGLSKTVYLWIDTNLSTNKYMKEIKKELKFVFQHENVGIVGCLKTIGDGTVGKEDFSVITKAKPEFFEEQFKNISFLVNALKADFYLYIIPILKGNQVETRLRIEGCIRKLRQIDENLPLRVNILHIHYDYGPVGKNVDKALTKGRSLPSSDEKQLLHQWYKEVVPSLYSNSPFYNNYRCKIPLREGMRRKT
jgi:uncharacterized Fe-S cluster-containing radical SAM superfamily protein